MTPLNETLELSAQQYRQYSRVMLLSDIGEAGQLAIMNSSVMIIGVGGLGQLVAQYLAAAGIGHIRLVDGDVVELSNLPRQLLLRQTDIGKSKASVAKTTLNIAYPAVKIDVITENVNQDNWAAIGRETSVSNQVVFDCTDNFNSRQLINQMCVQYRLTLVSGAMSAYQGQLFCIDFLSAKHGCYQCLYPIDMQVNQNCTEAGVLGPAVGIIASMQALVGIQHITRTFTEYGILQRVDARNLHWKRAQMTPDPHCEICSQLASVQNRS